MHWLARIKHLPLSDGNWSYSRPACGDDPAQGWKLHVSATILSAAEVFSRAEPILRRNDTLFKVPCRLELLKSLNSGLTDFSQIGKFLTVYPRSTDEALELARELHRATQWAARSTDPVRRTIPRRKAWSTIDMAHSVVRPTANRDSSKLQEESFIETSAHLGGRFRSWLEDPFQKSPSKNSKWRGLISRSLLVFKAKAQRGKGGVYEAVDLSVLPVRRVIIKEGRRHGETNWDGRDGYALVRHEARVLRKLRKAGLAVPEIFREFTQDGNRYLVLERITGRPLLAAKQIQPDKNFVASGREDFGATGADVIQDARRWLGVARLQAIAHFCSSRKVRLIDFEGACRIDQSDLLPWGSPDYIPPAVSRKVVSTCRNTRGRLRARRNRISIPVRAISARVVGAAVPQFTKPLVVLIRCGPGSRVCWNAENDRKRKWRKQSHPSPNWARC